MKKLTYKLLLVLFLSFSTLINAQWETITIDTTAQVSDIFVLNDRVFLKLDTNFVFSDLLVSVDQGETWSNITSSLHDSISSINDMKFIDNRIYLATNFGVFVSDDNGQSWTARTNGIGNNTVHCLYEHDGILLAGGFQNIYRSTDSGENWSSNVVASFRTVVKIVSDDNYIFAHAFTFGLNHSLLRSSDGGLIWGQVNAPPKFDELLVFNNNTSFLGRSSSNGNGLFWSRNNFSTFSEFDENDWFLNKPIESLHKIGDNFFVAVLGVGLAYRGSGGWHYANDGLESTIINKIESDDSYIYLVYRNNYISRRLLSELNLITSVSTENQVLPSEYKLSQNYPNPFNPSTTISYSIPTHSNVSLKIYDIVGKEVADLVNSEKAAGLYEINFDATELTSGIYFYQIISDGFSATRKMILLK